MLLQLSSPCRSAATPCKPRPGRRGPGAEREDNKPGWGKILLVPIEQMAQSSWSALVEPGQQSRRPFHVQVVLRAEYLAEVRLLGADLLDEENRPGQRQ